MTHDPARQTVPDIVHGTCVALGAHAALLRGDSGSGKSDLAFRFLALPDGDEGPPRLVADDQVCLTATGDGLSVSPPANLAGLIEVRGLGIQPTPSISAARLVLVCDLVDLADVPRMPPDPWDCTVLGGISLDAESGAFRGIGATKASNGDCGRDGTLARRRTIGFRKARIGLAQSPSARPK